MTADDLFRSYLIAYLFWLGVGAGSLGALLLQDLTGGKWGRAAAPILEAGSLTLPWMALLFVPVVIGAGRIYPWWAHAADARYNPMYLNRTFFVIRAAVYFLLWGGAAVGLERLGEARRAGGGAWWAGPALVAHVLAITFASIDWAASIDAPWGSTIYGFLWICGFGVAAFCLCILASAWRAGSRPMPAQYSHDLGNLLLAFVMLWAYMSFVQWLVIWSGDLPDEIRWYLARGGRGWEWTAAALAALGFFAPFYALLMRGVKRSLPRLAAVAGALAALRLVDVVWLVAPSFGVGAFRPRVLHLVVFLAVGGVWLSLFARKFRAKVFEPGRFYGA